MTARAVIIDNQNRTIGIVTHSTLDSDEHCGKAALLLHKSTKPEIQNRLIGLEHRELRICVGFRILQRLYCAN
jgi:hypothetical protein